MRCAKKGKSSVKKCEKKTWMRWSWGAFSAENVHIKVCKHNALPVTTSYINVYVTPMQCPRYLIGKHTYANFELCMCVCVYWPWLAAPAGAPWWLQGSCPAESAARTQSEPTSLLCPFLPAATRLPGTRTCTHVRTSPHNIFTMCTVGLCAHVNTKTSTNTHTRQREDGWVSGDWGGEGWQLVTMVSRLTQPAWREENKKAENNLAE